MTNEDILKIKFIKQQKNPQKAIGFFFIYIITTQKIYIQFKQHKYFRRF